jgi:hypothetical protein
VPVPLRFAPPLLDVEEVPGGVGFVAGDVPVLLDELLEELVELEVGLLLLVVVAAVLVAAVEDDVVELLELLQSRAASSLTVLAPWLRFCDRVVLIVEGRLVTALVSAADALLACAQLWASTACETESSWLVRLLFWSAESSPFVLPQATANAAANPRPPARNAREPKPMRRLTLACVRAESRLLAVEQPLRQ